MILIGMMLKLYSEKNKKKGELMEMLYIEKEKDKVTNLKSDVLNLKKSLKCLTEFI